MPKILYVAKKFNPKAQAAIDIANNIIAFYATQGLDLTLRQLYYQFVSRGHLLNTEKSYVWLGDIISDARLAGLIDWNSIVDRTRNLESRTHWEHPKDLVDAAAKSYANNLWENQSNYVEVWIEKDALKGVIEGICTRLDVPFFSCRGYTSQSEMWVAGQRLITQAAKGKELFIIHLGDHDPSGMDMSRDIKERLSLFIAPHDITVRRIALNWPQIQRFNPPPNPAKVTDSRAKDYIAKYGGESWELDALDPAELIRLIRGHIRALRDKALWIEAKQKQERGRKVLQVIYNRWQEVMKLLAT